MLKLTFASGQCRNCWVWDPFFARPWVAAADEFHSMTRDLELNVGMRYSIVSLLFFPTAVIFEIPVTIIIRWIGPRIFFSLICMTWAVTMIGFGFVNNWQQLAGVRVVLGALEAGFLPGCLYFLRCVMVKCSDM